MLKGVIVSNSDYNAGFNLNQSKKNKTMFSYRAVKHFPHEATGHLQGKSRIDLTQEK